MALFPIFVSLFRACFVEDAGFSYVLLCLLCCDCSFWLKSVQTTGLRETGSWERPAQIPGNTVFLVTMPKLSDGNFLKVSCNCNLKLHEKPQGAF